MKRILFTLLAIFATVNLARAQEPALSYRGIPDSVAYKAFEWKTTYGVVDTLGINLHMYIVKGFTGNVFCPDEFGQAEEYLLKWGTEWGHPGDPYRNHASGVTYHKETCGTNHIRSFSIAEDAMPANFDGALGYPQIYLKRDYIADDWTYINIRVRFVDSSNDFPEGTSSGNGDIPLFRVNTVSSEYENPQELPNAISLKQNYPNPFNPRTTITYQIDAPQHVRLDVFNAQGQRIQTLVDGMRPAGQHSVRFDAGSLPSGLYVYRLQTRTETRVRKMMLVR